MTYLEELHRAHKARAIRLGASTGSRKIRIKEMEPVKVEIPVARPVRDWLRVASPRPDHKLSVAQVVAATAREFGVEPNDILSQRRTDYSFPKIGRFIGGRDHTTALHGYRKINKLVESDGDLCRHVEAIILALNEAQEAIVA